MALTWSFFDFECYGVGFYEEEISSVCEQGAEAVDGTSSGDGAEDVYKLMSAAGHLNALHDHNYSCKYEEGLQSQPESAQEHMNEPDNLAAINLYSSRRKQYKLTSGQLSELERVFQETPYLDALKRRELAASLNINERTVKVLFNKMRAKLREDERALLLTDTQQQHLQKTLEEPKKVIVIHQPVVEGYLQHIQQLDEPC